MSTPIVRQTAWISLLPQLGFMGFLMLLYYAAGTDQFIIFGAGTYLVISRSLRFFLLKHHRQAVALVKAGDFRAAISGFQSSYNFLNKYPWIDRYRYLTLLSSSRPSYKEMALNNIAFSYSQIGEGEKAILYYNQMLAEYPESELAKAALNFISSIRDRDAPGENPEGM
ncbi:tetratricopeptide repeat protein [Dyadobacter sandarakinus]|uniref:Tetratricopeptide repeat protein n=1 Tax=Dyadobacter sandarakinus TaxID=2747268 RepID=A0ABX7I9J0_9BACT|nr:hypothetical protein [Dyadobacter sandarakinus]QRR02483.1 hypothetical protein HWI92_16990 [Dyadobacter sandarakinus]